MVNSKQVFEWLNFTLIFKFGLTAYALFYGADWLLKIYDAFKLEQQLSRTVLTFSLLLALLFLGIYYGINQNAYPTKTLATIAGVLLLIWLLSMKVKPTFGWILGAGYFLLMGYVYYIKKELR